MRLSEWQRKVIRETVIQIFGETAKVWLFGSRIDNLKRGGDIDLLIETDNQDVSKLVQAEIKLSTQLQLKLGEQKIDILIDYPTRSNRPPIFDIAKQTGILL